MRRNAEVSASEGKTLARNTVRRDPPAREEIYAPKAPKKGSETSQGALKKMSESLQETIRALNPSFWSATKKTIESVIVRNPGIQSWCSRFTMGRPLLFAMKIFRCKSRQLVTWESTR
jgi:hypothetical protein